MLEFHGAICDILGIAPVLSPQQLAILDERERVCGIRFPASVREWFAIDNAESLFSRHSNADNLVPVSELGKEQHLAQNWLLVAWENQAVVLWFCKLNGAHDPQVWHDDNQYHDVPFSEIPWRQDSASFSAFIFDFLANSYYDSWSNGLHIEATSQSLPDNMLPLLRLHFKQGPYTEENERMVYRFYNEQALVYIAQDKLSEEVQWIIQPVSKQALRAVIALLKPSRAWLETWQSDGHREWSQKLGKPLPTTNGQQVIDEYRTNQSA